MEKSMLMVILKEMQKKYQCIVEIQRITKEMGEFLSRNDRTSVQMLIGMRQEEMDKADVCERNIGLLIGSLPVEEASMVRDWIKGNSDRKPETTEEKLLIEKCDSIRRILNNTIQIDRHISTRLAGKDSFYK